MNAAAAQIATGDPASPGAHLPALFDHPVNVGSVLQHVAVVHEIAQKVMQENVHYGTIAGTDKPTIYQPGAQVLALAFGFRTDSEETAMRPSPEGAAA